MHQNRWSARANISILYLSANWHSFLAILLFQVELLRFWSWWTFVSLFIVILSTKSDTGNICVHSNAFHHHNKPNKLPQATPTSSHPPFAILRLWTSSYSLWPSSTASSSPPLPPGTIRDCCCCGGGDDVRNPIWKSFCNNSMTVWSVYVMFRCRTFVANPVCWGKKRLLYLKSMCPPCAEEELFERKSKQTSLSWIFDSEVDSFMTYFAKAEETPTPSNSNFSDKKSPHWLEVTFPTFVKGSRFASFHHPEKKLTTHSSTG